MKKKKKKNSAVDETPRSPSSTSKETAEILQHHNAPKSPIQLESLEKQENPLESTTMPPTTTKSNKTKKKTTHLLLPTTTKKPRKLHPAKVRQQKLAKEAASVSLEATGTPAATKQKETTKPTIMPNKKPVKTKPPTPKAAKTSSTPKPASVQKKVPMVKPSAVPRKKTPSVASSFPNMSQTTLPRHNLSRLPDPYYETNSITSVDEYLAREHSRKQTAPVESIDTFFQKTAKKEQQQQHPDDEEDVSVLTMDPTLQAISRREAEGLITYPKRPLSAMEEEEYDPADDLSEIAPLDLVSL